MDRRELDRAVETRDVFRALLPHRGGRVGIAGCGIAIALLLSMLVRVIGAVPALPVAPVRETSLVRASAQRSIAVPAAQARDSAAGERVR